MKNKLKESENHIKEIEKKNSSQAAAMNDLETTVKRMKSEIEKKNKYEQEKTFLIYQIKFLEKSLEQYEPVLRFDISNSSTNKCPADE